MSIMVSNDDWKVTHGPKYDPTMPQNCQACEKPGYPLIELAWAQRPDTQASRLWVCDGCLKLFRKNGSRR